MNIKDVIRDSISTKEKILSDEGMIGMLQMVATTAVNVFRAGNKILLCGNGGSAADAQHIAAELSGRFYTDRNPLPAEALHVNSSYLTAVANDYSFDVVYSRMVKALGNKGDMLIAFSTSGNSKNVILALEEAKRKGMVTVGFTGQDGGRMKELCDFVFRVPSSDTPRIQESHIMLGHIICQLIEENIPDEMNN